MRSKSFINVVNAVFGPDPIAAPGSVTEAMLVTYELKTAEAVGGGVGFYLWFNGVAGETITLDLFALVEPTPTALGSRQYVRLAGAVAVTANILTSVTGIPQMARGRLYPRVTASTIAAPRNLNLSV